MSKNNHETHPDVANASGEHGDSVSQIDGQARAEQSVQILHKVEMSMNQLARDPTYGTYNPSVNGNRFLRLHELFSGTPLALLCYHSIRWFLQSELADGNSTVEVSSLRLFRILGIITMTLVRAKSFYRRHSYTFSSKGCHTRSEISTYDDIDTGFTERTVVGRHSTVEGELRIAEIRAVDLDQYGDQGCGYYAMALGLGLDTDRMSCWVEADLPYNTPLHHTAITDDQLVQMAVAAGVELEIMQIQHLSNVVVHTRYVQTQRLSRGAGRRPGEKKVRILHIPARSHYQLITDIIYCKPGSSLYDSSGHVIHLDLDYDDRQSSDYQKSVAQRQGLSVQEADLTSSRTVVGDYGTQVRDHVSLAISSHRAPGESGILVSPIVYEFPALLNMTHADPAYIYCQLQDAFGKACKAEDLVQMARSSGVESHGVTACEPKTIPDCVEDPSELTQPFTNVSSVTQGSESDKEGCIIVAQSETASDCVQIRGLSDADLELDRIDQVVAETRPGRAKRALARLDLGDDKHVGCGDKDCFKEQEQGPSIKDKPPAPLCLVTLGHQVTTFNCDSVQHLGIVLAHDADVKKKERNYDGLAAAFSLDVAYQEQLGCTYLTTRIHPGSTPDYAYTVHCFDTLPLLHQYLMSHGLSTTLRREWGDRGNDRVQQLLSASLHPIEIYTSFGATRDYDHINLNTTGLEGKQLKKRYFLKERSNLTWAAPQTIKVVKVHNDSRGPVSWFLLGQFIEQPRTPCSLTLQQMIQAQYATWGTSHVGHVHRSQHSKAAQIDELYEPQSYTLDHLIAEHEQVSRAAISYQNDYLSFSPQLVGVHANLAQKFQPSEKSSLGLLNCGRHGLVLSLMAAANRESLLDFEGTYLGSAVRNSDVTFSREQGIIIVDLTISDDPRAYEHKLDTLERACRDAAILFPGVPFVPVVLVCSHLSADGIIGTLESAPVTLIEKKTSADKKMAAQFSLLEALSRNLKYLVGQGTLANFFDKFMRACPREDPKEISKLDESIANFALTQISAPGRVLAVLQTMRQSYPRLYAYAVNQLHRQVKRHRGLCVATTEGETNGSWFEVFSGFDVPENACVVVSNVTRVTTADDDPSATGQTTEVWEPGRIEWLKDDEFEGELWLKKQIISGHVDFGFFRVKGRCIRGYTSCRAPRPFRELVNGRDNIWEPARLTEDELLAQADDTTEEQISELYMRHIDQVHGTMSGQVGEEDSCDRWALSIRDVLASGIYEIGDEMKVRVQAEIVYALNSAARSPAFRMLNVARNIAEGTILSSTLGSGSDLVIASWPGGGGYTMSRCTGTLLSENDTCSVSVCRSAASHSQHDGSWVYSRSGDVVLSRCLFMPKRSIIWYGVAQQTVVSMMLIEAEGYDLPSRIDYINRLSLTALANRKPLCVALKLWRNLAGSATSLSSDLDVLGSKIDTVGLSSFEVLTLVEMVGRTLALAHIRDANRLALVTKLLPDGRRFLSIPTPLGGRAGKSPAGYANSYYEHVLCSGFSVSSDNSITYATLDAVKHGVEWLKASNQPLNDSIWQARMCMSTYNKIVAYGESELAMDELVQNPRFWEEEAEHAIACGLYGDKRYNSIVLRWVVAHLSVPPKDEINRGMGAAQRAWCADLKDALTTRTNVCRLTSRLKPALRTITTLEREFCLRNNIVRVNARSLATRFAYRSTFSGSMLGVYVEAYLISHKKLFPFEVAVVDKVGTIEKTRDISITAAVDRMVQAALENFAKELSSIHPNSALQTKWKHNAIRQVWAKVEKKEHQVRVHIMTDKSSYGPTKDGPHIYAGILPYVHGTDFDGIFRRVLGDLTKKAVKPMDIFFDQNRENAHRRYGQAYQDAEHFAGKNGRRIPVPTGMMQGLLQNCADLTTGGATWAFNAVLSYLTNASCASVTTNDDGYSVLTYNVKFVRNAATHAQSACRYVGYAIGEVPNLGKLSISTLLADLNTTLVIDEHEVYPYARSVYAATMVSPQPDMRSSIENAMTATNAAVYEGASYVALAFASCASWAAHYFRTRTLPVPSVDDSPADEDNLLATTPVIAPVLTARFGAAVVYSAFCTDSKRQLAVASLSKITRLFGEQQFSWDSVQTVPGLALSSMECRDGRYMVNILSSSHPVDRGTDSLHEVLEEARECTAEEYSRLPLYPSVLSHHMHAGIAAKQSLTGEIYRVTSIMHAWAAGSIADERKRYSVQWLVAKNNTLRIETVEALGRAEVEEQVRSQEKLTIEGEPFPGLANENIKLQQCLVELREMRSLDRLITYTHGLSKACQYAPLQDASRPSNPYQSAWALSSDLIKDHIRHMALVNGEDVSLMPRVDRPVCHDPSPASLEYDDDLPGLLGFSALTGKESPRQATAEAATGLDVAASMARGRAYDLAFSQAASTRVIIVRGQNDRARDITACDILSFNFSPFKKLVSSSSLHSSDVGGRSDEQNQLLQNNIASQTLRCDYVADSVAQGLLTTAISPMSSSVSDSPSVEGLSHGSVLTTEGRMGQRLLHNLLKSRRTFFMSHEQLLDQFARSSNTKQRGVTRVPGMTANSTPYQVVCHTPSGEKVRGLLMSVKSVNDDCEDTWRHVLVVPSEVDSCDEKNVNVRSRCVGYGSQSEPLEVVTPRGFCVSLYGAPATYCIDLVDYGLSLPMTYCYAKPAGLTLSQRTMMDDVSPLREEHRLRLGLSEVLYASPMLAESTLAYASVYGYPYAVSKLIQDAYLYRNTLWREAKERRIITTTVEPAYAEFGHLAPDNFLSCSGFVAHVIASSLSRLSGTSRASTVGAHTLDFQLRQVRERNRKEVELMEYAERRRQQAQAAKRKSDNYGAALSEVNLLDLIESATLEFEKELEDNPLQPGDRELTKEEQEAYDSVGVGASAQTTDLSVGEAQGSEAVASREKSSVGGDLTHLEPLYEFRPLPMIPTAQGGQLLATQMTEISYLWYSLAPVYNRNRHQYMICTSAREYVQQYDRPEEQRRCVFPVWAIIDEACSTTFLVHDRGNRKLISLREQQGTHGVVGVYRGGFRDQDVLITDPDWESLVTITGVTTEILRRSTRGLVKMKEREHGTVTFSGLL